MMNQGLISILIIPIKNYWGLCGFCEKAKLMTAFEFQNLKTGLSSKYLQATYFYIMVESKDNVKVAIRIRPLNHRESNEGGKKCVVIQDPGRTLYIGEKGVRHK